MERTRYGYEKRPNGNGHPSRVLEKLNNLPEFIQLVSGRTPSKPQFPHL